MERGARGIRRIISSCRSAASIQEKIVNRHLLSFLRFTKYSAWSLRSILDNNTASTFLSGLVRRAVSFVRSSIGYPICNRLIVLTKTYGEQICLMKWMISQPIQCTNQIVKAFRDMPLRPGANIMVMGVGGAGRNAIRNMRALGLDQFVELVAIDTDMGCDIQRFGKKRKG